MFETFEVLEVEQVMMALLTFCRLDSFLLLGHMLFAQLLGCNSGIQQQEALAHPAAA